MPEEIKSKIDGAFDGYNGDAIFRLANGQVWQQARYKYKYAYRPEVRIYRTGAQCLMEVSVMDEPIEVVRASIVEEGTITSDFNGFDGNSQFTFDSGSVWRQAEYKYSYHYAYRPHAVVIGGKGGTQIHVDGMSDTVRVERAR